MVLYLRKADLMIYLNGYLYIAHSYILQYVSLVESQISTKILFGFVLGMMMAIDNGGPINKTAYVFGIGMLISYDYYPMAAVMAGGMIPPFVIALTATLSKNRFSNRKDALMNYINGISFISEGAIPFIQQESTVILPACCLAAGIAGALSMYFECSITSPHGGLFLIWMVNNPLYYLALIVLSTVVGTLLLFIFTKSKIKNLKGIPFYMFTGGHIGILTVLFTNIGFMGLGVSLTVSLSLLGQLVTSLVIDHFGYFNMTVVEFDKKKILGLIIIIAGIYVMTLS